MKTYHINVYPNTTSKEAIGLLKKTFKVKATDEKSAKEAVREAISAMGTGLLTIDYKIEIVEELELEVHKNFTLEEKLIILLKASLEPDWSTILVLEANTNFSDMVESIEDTDKDNYDTNYWNLLEYLRAGGIRTVKDLTGIDDKLYPSPTQEKQMPFFGDTKKY